MDDRELALAHLDKRVVDCRRCPRLVSHREEVARVKRPAYRTETYWSRPVPGFGDPGARLLIVGLAPAAHGANRTGRMFTGDGPRGAGDFLVSALHRAGLANQPTSSCRDDGLRLRGVYLTAVVRCAPPRNRPSGQEIRSCLPYLVHELAVLSDVRTVLALGKIAFDGCVGVLRSLGGTIAAPRFAHAARHEPGTAFPALVASYHPSRQNTQTGRLTPRMFDWALDQALI
ncbi:MAG: Uracil-DNA glycosylase, family 5 [Candidatus Bipolaricaulis sibiricus]|uniref:Type-5 uracil-DNA glycosylase n=1 Tax=Bipolaricaulis sibiricus TaxID=2501609 RepID=A0A410FWN0_BIPS1|nr:MAG: Uracil-DNA glycosylase, family 5 [Candidatus Bipolaricaulis sibiricus]